MSDEMFGDDSVNEVPKDVTGEPTLVAKSGNNLNFNDLESLDEAVEEKEVSEVKAQAKKEVALEKAKEDIKQEEVVKEQVRLIKILAGDKEIEVSALGKLLAKVDGKDEEVTVDELLKNYSGKVAYDKRFTELDKRRKLVDSKEVEIRSVNENLKKLAELTKNGDSYAALDFLCDMAGVDRMEFLNNYLSEAEKIAKEVGAMSDDQKDAFRAKKEAEYYKSKVEQDKKARDLADQNNLIKSQVDNLCEQTGVSKELFTEAFKYLSEKGHLKENKDDAMTLAGKICNYVKSVEKYSVIEKGVALVDEKLNDDDGFVEELYKYVDNDFTPQDVADIVKEVFSKKTKSSAKPSKESKPEKETEKETPRKAKEATPERQPSEDEEDEIGFGDLISMHR